MHDNNDEKAKIMNLNQSRNQKKEEKEIQR